MQSFSQKQNQSSEQNNPGYQVKFANNKLKNQQVRRLDCSNTTCSSTETTRSEHHFSHMLVQAPCYKFHPGNQKEEINGHTGEDDPIHRPLIDQFRLQEHLPSTGLDEAGSPEGPSDAEIKYGGLVMPCPQLTQVDKIIDLQNTALAAGHRTAYGIHAQMKVLPDARTWNGTTIIETLTTGASNCPATLTKGESCSGNSHFIVGGPSGNSSVGGGPRPGARNRFWDFHVSHVRPPGLSVLHDKNRNPNNIATCSTVCNQQYNCGGKVIGNHTITRTFSKAKFNNQDVTLVNVTKT
jgi:hypothetical protein